MRVRDALFGRRAVREGKAAIEAPHEWVQIAPIIAGEPKATPGPFARAAPQIRWLGVNGDPARRRRWSTGNESAARK